MSQNSKGWQKRPLDANDQLFSLAQLLGLAYFFHRPNGYELLGLDMGHAFANIFDLGVQAEGHKCFYTIQDVIYWDSYTVLGGRW